MKSRKYLKDYIHRIRRSQDRQSILRAVLRFACVGAVLLMICILISRLRHFYYADLIGVICISTAAAAGLIWGLIHRGRPEDTAVYLDSFGMKEKLITAYEAPMNRIRAISEICRLKMLQLLSDIEKRHLQPNISEEAERKCHG